jgi:hypothetical protein
MTRLPLLAVDNGRGSAEALAQFIAVRFDSEDIDGLTNPFHGTPDAAPG